MIVDFRINDSFQGTTIKIERPPNLQLKIRGQRQLEKVEVLRNSTVIKEMKVYGNTTEFDTSFIDENYLEEQGICYYYIRATQKNNEIAWSSPVWVEQA